MNDIVIVDYGVGNLGSIANMLTRVGARSVISSDSATIEKASKLILPGVGAFGNGMRNLNESGFLPILNRRVLQDKVPILGICLGAQLFFEKSSEGDIPGLGWIHGEVVKFNFPPADRKLKVPHMGWNIVRPRRESALFRDAQGEQRFYFVHSYYLAPKDPSVVLTTTNYGHEFASGIQSGNIHGVQFHPEKSHKFGMKLLKNFAEAI
jgi:glutamine amidotransferase